MMPIGYPEALEIQGFHVLCRRAALLWSWVSGVRVPSLTPLNAVLTRGFIVMTPGAGPAGALEWGQTLLSRSVEGPQAAVTVTLEWAELCWRGRRACTARCGDLSPCRQLSPDNDAHERRLCAPP